MRYLENKKDPECGIDKIKENVNCIIMIHDDTMTAVGVNVRDDGVDVSSSSLQDSESRSPTASLF